MPKLNSTESGLGRLEALTPEAKKNYSSLVNSRATMIRDIKAFAENHKIDTTAAVHRLEESKFSLEMDGCIEDILTSGQLTLNLDELKTKWNGDFQKLLAKISEGK